MKTRLQARQNLQAGKESVVVIFIDYLLHPGLLFRSSRNSHSQQLYTKSAYFHHHWMFLNFSKLLNFLLYSLPLFYISFHHFLLFVKYGNNFVILLNKYFLAVSYQSLSTFKDIFGHAEICKFVCGQIQQSFLCHLGFPFCQANILSSPKLSK